MTITQQEIIDLAVEAGCVKMDWLEVNAAFMQRFANLAYQRGVRDEQEAAMRARGHSCPPCNQNCNQGRDCPGAKR